jgi:hypothetical protein
MLAWPFLPTSRPLFKKNVGVTTFPTPRQIKIFNTARMWQPHSLLRNRLDLESLQYLSISFLNFVFVSSAERDR